MFSLSGCCYSFQPSTVVKYKLAEHDFTYFFPDEPPVFAFSPPGKGKGRRPNDTSPTEVCVIVGLHICLELDVMFATWPSWFRLLQAWHDIKKKKFRTYATSNTVSLKRICFPILDELCWGKVKIDAAERTNDVHRWV